MRRHVGRIGVCGGYLGPLCSLSRLIPPRGTGGTTLMMGVSTTRLATPAARDATGLTAYFSRLMSGWACSTDRARSLSFPRSWSISGRSSFSPGDMLEYGGQRTRRKWTVDRNSLIWREPVPVSGPFTGYTDREKHIWFLWIQRTLGHIRSAVFNRAAPCERVCFFGRWGGLRQVGIMFGRQALAGARRASS